MNGRVGSGRPPNRRRSVRRRAGLARETIRNGRRELAQGVGPSGRIRAPGRAARVDQTQPGLTAALEALVEPVTRGDPMSPLRWTCKSRAKLTAVLTTQGWQVSSTTVGRLLNALGYRLQSVRKSREGTSHPDRNAQFEHYQRDGRGLPPAQQQPVISVDTKKKELVGDFKNAGREWQPTGTPEAVRVHDFPGDAVGKAIPYGVYDMARNEAWVSVGRDHDTPAFAVASIRQWWTMMGPAAYPEATAPADHRRCGREQRLSLARVEAGTATTGRRPATGDPRLAFPPGTSKWNKIEHRLFCHITENWRGRPLRTFETVVELIGHTTTAAGLRVKAKLDKRRDPRAKSSPARKCATSHCTRMRFMATGTMNCDHGQVDNSISIKRLTGQVGAILQ